MEAITITVMRQFINTYEVSGKVGNGGRYYSKQCHGQGAAAAQAVAYAQANLRGADYVIIGPKEVMDLIPPQIRTGKSA